MSKTYRLFVTLVCAVALTGITGAALAQSSSGNQSKKNDVKVTKHKDWEVHCPKSGQKDQCEMTQLINNPGNGKPIMRVIMGYPPQAQGQPAMIFILPLGTRLNSGVQVTVDNHKAHRFPFQICLEQGCQAAFPVKSSFLNQLKHGKSAQASIVGPKGNPINLKISLMGFTAANNQISP